MRYEFHPEAEVDLVETILYYETQAPGLVRSSPQRSGAESSNCYCIPSTGCGLSIRFDLIVNVQTAKALGIRIPQTILLPATRVIE